MPPRSQPKKKSEILENETNQMESIMNMLKSQIDEERNKVKNMPGPRWAAAEDGPIHNFDPHGKLARKILRKKKPAPEEPKTPKSGREKANSISDAPKEAVKAEKSASNKNVEVVVEPQRGALWGPPPENTEADVYLPPNDKTVQEDEPELPPPGAGGSLWGPPPDEQAESLKFQQELAKIRGVRTEEEKKPAETKNAEIDKPPIAREKAKPTAFTYFDRLVTKDIIDGTRMVDQNK